MIIRDRQMPQLIDDSIWIPYNFKDNWNENYRESYRAVIEGGVGFYMLRQCHLGYWHGWYFKDQHDVDNTFSKNRIFFGFNIDDQVIKHRMFSCMCLDKMNSFSPAEHQAADEDYEKNFSPK